VVVDALSGHGDLLLGVLSASLRKIRTGKLLKASAVTSSCSSIEEFTLCQLGRIANKITSIRSQLRGHEPPNGRLTSALKLYA
jgi:hypothetical protein